MALIEPDATQPARDVISFAPEGEPVPHSVSVRRLVDLIRDVFFLAQCSKTEALRTLLLKYPAAK
jgi:hypothetical protein